MIIGRIGGAGGGTSFLSSLAEVGVGVVSTVTFGSGTVVDDVAGVAEDVLGVVASGDGVFVGRATGLAGSILFSFV